MRMHVKPLIYVAGPIAGHDYDTVTRWRVKVQRALPECEILTPMRGKEYLEKYEIMPLTSEQLTSEGRDFRGDALDAEISSTRAIIRRDTWDVERCDLVLANFLPGDESGKVSIGTACECYLAAYLHKPVVQVLTAGGPHDHPFITGAAWVVVRTLDEAFAAARIALNLPVALNLKGRL